MQQMDACHMIWICSAGLQVDFWSPLGTGAAEEKCSFAPVVVHRTFKVLVYSSLHELRTPLSLVDFAYEGLQGANILHEVEVVASCIAQLTRPI